jgi:hypothetical protein
MGGTKYSLFRVATVGSLIMVAGAMVYVVVTSEIPPEIRIPTYIPRAYLLLLLGLSLASGFPRSGNRRGR